MAIKYLSINNEVLNINDYSKINETNNCSITNNNPYFRICNPNINMGVAPDTNEFAQYIFGTTDNQISSFLARMLFYKNTDTQTALEFDVRQNITNDTASIVHGYTAKGEKFTNLNYDPSSTSNSQQIATTKWVRDLLTRIGVL